MKKTLFEIYVMMLVPVLLAISVLYIIDFLNLFKFNTEVAARPITITIFILAAAFSIALPIFYRSLFVNTVKNENNINLYKFISFEKNLTIIAMVAPYFIPLALLLNLSSFYLVAIVLFGLYSVYYYYPSEKRINFEKKLFRINEDLE